MRKLARLLLPFIILGSASFAYAQSASDTQAQLNALLAQLAALQAQLQTQGGGSSIPIVTGGTYGQCPNFSRSLRQGMSGSDVTALQAFLAADTRIYPEATISGYFGALTMAAVQRFQLRHAIVTSGTPDSTGYGAVGPATRRAIAGLCGAGVDTSTASGSNCVLNGTQLASGITKEFYSAAIAPAGATCASLAQTRQCINGSLSGNPTYQYPTCADATTLSCTVNGTTIANGVTFQFFSRQTVGSSESCIAYSQTRTCTNGAMTGSSSYLYLTCNTRAPDSCSYAGITLPSGQSQIFYKQDTATSTNSCTAQSQTRICTDGVLSGDNAYSKTNCTAGACMAGTLTIPNGSTTQLYLAQNIPSSEQCSSYVQTRTCSNGALSGNAAYQYQSCTPAASGTCVIDSAVLTNGQSSTFYSTSTAPVGSTCGAVSQTRTCTNGTLSGGATYIRASCTATASCTLGGVTVPNGDSYTFYSASSVAFGSTCSSQSQTRFCTNGSLSGAAGYQYSSCTVNPPTALGPKEAQLAAALTALQSILQSLLDTLDSWF